MKFNFNLHLLPVGHLRLPCELVARAEMPMFPSGEDQAASQAVGFQTSDKECLRQGWPLGSDVHIQMA